MEKKKSKKKPLLITLGIVIVLVFIAAALFTDRENTTSVQTQDIKRADIISEVSGSGRVEPKTKVKIVSEVNAEIIILPVKEGDYVSKGQMLIQLDTVQLKSDMESALFAAQETQARVEGAKVLLDQYQYEYDLQKELFAKDLSFEKVYRDSKYAYQRQQADYKAWIQQQKSSESRLAKARDNLGKTTISSPMDGIVTLVEAEKGEIAQAQTSFTQGKTLMVVSDLSAFEIEVEIDETDIKDLELNQRANVEIDAFPDTVFSGQVVEIGNTATTSGYGSNDQTTNFKVKITLTELHPKIRPGMSSTVDIVTNEHKDVVSVPIQAVVMRKFTPDSLASFRQVVSAPQEDAQDDSGESFGSVAHAATPDDNESDSSLITEEVGDDEKIDVKGVFVNREGEARFIEIKTGIADQQNYEVLSGLETGDEVIIGSFQTLRSIEDGESIEVNNIKKKQE
ncbi:MAG: efflux RND transporter periplasmic adaptor subunit [candidate division Zixibacteria bacterium]|nr:efflux RND transporter periplasmic adaptor subunit [candidate division Zixibacteria bacterium]